MEPDLNREVGEIKSQVRHLTAEVSEIKADVKELLEFKWRSIGFAGLAAFLATFFIEIVRAR